MEKGRGGKKGFHTFTPSSSSYKKRGGPAFLDSLRYGRGGKRKSIEPLYATPASDNIGRDGEKRKDQGESRALFEARKKKKREGIGNPY